jgi:chromosomal replication initiator protein
LHNAHRQIVLAADRMPREIGLEDRMITRFDGGLSAEILPPTLETRVAILRKKQELQSVKLDDELLFLIAARIQSNLRTLESALTVLTMHVSALHCPMDRELAERLLRDKFDVAAERAVTVDRIQQRVAERFALKVADILGKRRPQEIARARMVAMYLTRELTPLSFPAIGEAFNRNHATVVHAVSAIRERMAADQEFGSTVSALARELKG